VRTRPSQLGRDRPQPAREKLACGSMQPPPAEEQAIDDQQDDCPDHRGQETGGFTDSIPAGGAAGITGHGGSGDAEEGGHNEATRIVAGHEEFGNNTDKQTDTNDGEDGHGIPLVEWTATLTGDARGNHPGAGGGRGGADARRAPRPRG